jgi:N utilization substance protein A
MVVSELRGEKIDIIPYNDEPARFVAKALSPARVREVLVDDDARQATVVVPDDQLSLAIGREGQNARLAARLTGWRIDIKSETEFATEEPESGYPEEETGGRCAAILGNGRRCPNASLPGSRFCGLDSHQALEGTGTVYVAGEPPAGEVAENGEVEEAVAEEALAEGAPSADGNDGLVEEAVAAEEAVVEEAVAEDVAAEDGDALEPAPEAAEPDALAADEPAPAEETAEEPAS